MKKIISILCAFLLISFTHLFAQLPPAAQLLYDSAYAQDPALVNLAINNGAQIIATPDGNSFYVQWFPTGSTPSTTPLIVSLPGSHCNAFMEFKSWHLQALAHGCGILALQWYRYQPVPPYDYFPDDTLYSYFDSALTAINYPSGKALLHGFSRGSARSYAMVFMDMQSGNNYFCTTISNAGAVTSGYPLYDSITNYGVNVFAGKHWNLFCGGQDTSLLQSGCPGMTNTRTWLQGQGAIVDIFIQDPALGHDGFQLPSSAAYKDSILDNYLLCYNGVSVGEDPGKTEITISPNPFSDEAVIRAGIPFQNASLSIYNTCGQEMKNMKNISGQEIKLRCGNLPGGLYFIFITQDNVSFYSNKLMLTNNHASNP